MDQLELFFEVGNITTQSVLGARRPLREELIEKGRKWLENRREEFCFLICSKSVQKIFKENPSQKEEQLRALIDVVISLKFSIPPMVVAKAIIVLGEDWFCKENESK
jgi:hypothetical protein